MKGQYEGPSEYKDTPTKGSYAKRGGPYRAIGWRVGGSVSQHQVFPNPSSVISSCCSNFSLPPTHPCNLFARIKLNLCPPPAPRATGNSLGAGYNEWIISTYFAVLKSYIEIWKKLAPIPPNYVQEIPGSHSNQTKKHNDSSNIRFLGHVPQSVAIAETCP